MERESCSFYKKKTPKKVVYMLALDIKLLLLHVYLVQFEQILYTEGVHTVSVSVCTNWPVMCSWHSSLGTPQTSQLLQVCL